MPDFSYGDLGRHIQAVIPEFNHGNSSNSWQEVDVALSPLANGVPGSSGRQTMRPVRAMCYNVPAKCFARDGTRFRHWVTPQRNVNRASQLAAGLGMIFTPTSKGYFSGEHEEFQRANGEADEDAEGGSEAGGNDKKKKVRRAFRYAFILPDDNNVSCPMFVIGYEELYNRELTEVLALRIWKFVFHGPHSDTELHRKLMDENNATFHSGGVAHTQVMMRNRAVLNEMKHNRDMAMQGNLEFFAGTQYLRVVNEGCFLDLIKQAGGLNMNDSGLPPIDFSLLPLGILNQRLRPSHDDLGGTCCLSPEYAYNAKRSMALSANLVDIETGDVLDVHPDYLAPSKYFDVAGNFLTHASNKSTGGFFVNIDPTCNNIFDAALPRKIYGNVSAGDELLKLFREERLAKERPELSNCSNAVCSEHFDAFVTEVDPTIAAMERQMGEHVFCYDSLDLNEAQRRAMNNRQFRYYGERDGENAYIIEPAQIDKDLQLQTQRVYSELVEPWLNDQHAYHSELNAELRTGCCATEDMLDCSIDDPSMQQLVDEMAKTQERHYDVIKELFELHANRFASIFQSKRERADLPMGYCAMWDGLMKELSKTTNNTASVAYEHGNELVADDISQFAHMHMWLGEFFEKDCFIEGRDRRIMDELFLHLFEQYSDVTFLVLLCGYKGNGKTLRTERAEAVFPDNWVTTGGPSSARAGQNGQSDAQNGKNVIYDEMVDELCDSDGSDRLEYWKQIVLKREYTYQRTVNMKNVDGSESQRTMKLKTPHRETHCICTNYGMAFTKDRDPSDTKFAMIDRSIAHMVRSIGKNAHTDTEFKMHMTKPAQTRKLAMFRMFVCLVGATKLLTKGVPAFQPNLAFANKVFDHLDNDVIVGEYNLPRRAPRKSLKREENLRTMCIMNAVCSVFMYKQASSLTLHAHSPDCCSTGSMGKRKQYLTGSVHGNSIDSKASRHAREYCSVWKLVNAAIQKAKKNAKTRYKFAHKTEDQRRAALDKTARWAAGTGKEKKKQYTTAYFAQRRDADANFKLATNGRNRIREAMRTTGNNKAGATFGIGSLTAVEFEAGRLLPNGEPQPFKMSMLWDVVRQLHPTMEQIFWAFSQSLDYNIGTASHTFAAMTALCESFGIRVGDFMRKPPQRNTDILSGAVPQTSPTVLMANMPAAPHQEQGQTPEEYQRLVDDYNHRASRQLRTDDSATEFPTLFAEGGLHEDERRDLLTGWARQRRATAKYRQQCASAGHSNAIMNDPVELISKVMSRVSLPPDARQDGGSTSDSPMDDDGTCMPLYPSCVMADVVQTSIMHTPAGMHQWATGGMATINHVGVCGALGVAPGFEFSKKPSRGGTCRWDCAWLRKTDIGGWLPYATTMKNMGNHTCKIFDIALNGLRDLLYLISTRDNARRITEEPKMPHSKKPSEAFVGPSGQRLPSGDTGSGGSILFIRMRGVRNTLTGEDRPYMDEETAQARQRKRHPYSQVKDVPLQRSVDYAMNHGRYPAMMPSISNNVVSGPPVRMVKDGEKKHLELNTAAAIEHVKFIAECSMRCSVHPGLMDEQEEFCDGNQGPEGMCVTDSVADGASGVGRREVTYKLPYAYDLPGMSITLDVMSRIYDPIGRNYYRQFRREFGTELGFNPVFEDAPHLCTRYVGFSTSNRLLVSLKLPTTRNEAFKQIDVGDEEDDEDAEPVTHSLVSLQLGHAADDDEMRIYRLARAGSRAMSGVKGDLFSMETWLVHSCTSLTERGMVRSRTDDVVIKMVADGPYGLRQRLAERVSEDINRRIDKDPAMAAAGLEQAGDETLPGDQLARVIAERKRTTRMGLCATMSLPPHLDGLRHYGQLQLHAARTKLTYENVAKPVVRSGGQQQKRKYAMSSVSQLYSNNTAFIARSAASVKRAAPAPSARRGRPC